ncbi:hypothetical protein CHS0354_029582 [Potamilus streckersoni]|uniref:Iron-binding zinc finger CDGSH type domain-containing protein n=1 Tax=Potamilus streckersoni TaxID=2493646 RepID=A0AAE0TA30_9BIVA|nr:hypothetical protein CHS0354_029582 [Potamilus streckersoni]
MYGPCSVANLVKGDIKYWCTCGLSKTQPWCDGSHKGTGFKPLKWTVSKSQTRFQICACKYTKDPPYCDATHTNVPCNILEQQQSCDRKQLHIQDCKLCTSCRWVPDF